MENPARRTALTPPTTARRSAETVAVAHPAGPPEGNSDTGSTRAPAASPSQPVEAIAEAAPRPPAGLSTALRLRLLSALTVAAGQQALIATLIAICLVLAAIDWYRYGGGLIGPVDIERDPPLPYDYRVDVNTADWIELQQLPGVGPTLARRIVAERTRGGPFAGPQDLQRRVRGIGPNALARFGAWVRFSQPPSTSSPHGGDR